MDTRINFTSAAGPGMKLSLLFSITVLATSCCILFSCNKNNDIKDPGKNEPIPSALCPSPSAVNVQVGYLQTQQAFSCDNQQLFITFTSVIEDSRCPMNVNCPWLGRATAVFSFNTGAAYELELGQNAQFNWNGYTINACFTELNPYPVYGVPYDINSNIATIAFSSL